MAWSLLEGIEEQRAGQPILAGERALRDRAGFLGHGGDLCELLGPPGRRQIVQLRVEAVVAQAGRVHWPGRLLAHPLKRSR